MMMTSGAKLLRGPEEPRTNFLELFFDLVFVVALAQLSHGLIQDLRWSDAFQTLVLLLALWWVWIMTASTTDLYDPQRTAIQLLVTVSMLGSLVMVVAVPDAFGERGLVFAGTYVAIHVGRQLFLVLALRGHELQSRSIRVLFWFGVSAVPWIAGAVAHGAARGALWTLAVAVDYGAVALRWPTPGLGRSPKSDLGILGEHLADRYRQFFIIVLGELILVSGLTLYGSGFAADRSAAFVVSFATTVLFWRIFIFRAGELLAEAGTAAPDPTRVAFWATYSYPFMVAGIVVTAVGVELVIAHPLGHPEPAWVAVILGGPALFLAGRAGFEYTVFSRVSRNRPIGVLVLAALAPAMLFVPPLLAALAATAVLAGIAVTDAARARGRPPERPSPPG
ncbi:low temperature requirement protein A [Micromonospora purpureochromogenes]|uniref:Low temperature requirement protein LtrA n=1 Tax=Micromonospora purpureochromogenes TaxID=47872 RepID=A0ABX2RJQ4_9ACTN|nr:low temperature requirement protein A [Micromonospora purpureochromogenes]NYF55359.1 low temperature requirement protein LtrA [Micromonospora purpureochromogenes]